MFFDEWWTLLRIVVGGTLAYVFLIIFLRLSGKRTLSKWNAFDFIVTIAFGSVLATVITSKSIALIEGLLALILLIFLQFVITSLSVRVKWFRKLIKSDPTFLYNEGQFLESAMTDTRVVKGEILAAVRSSNISAMEDVKAVILETDGSFSVIEKKENSTYSALEGVQNSSKN